MSTNELYQEMILDHYKNPRNCCSLDSCTHKAEGHNPLCGDELEIEVKVDHGKIEELAFHGAGCAISQASASMMTENLKGRSIEDAMGVYEKVHKMLTGEHPENGKELGKLQVLEGVSDYPARVKCASLAWHTLKNALKDGSTATTEE